MSRPRQISTEEYARRVAGARGYSYQNESMNPANVLEAVSEAIGKTRKELWAKGKGDKELVQARQWTAFLCRAWTDASYADIKKQTKMDCSAMGLANNVSEVAKGFYCKVEPVRIALERAGCFGKYEARHESDVAMYQSIFAPFRRAGAYQHEIDRYPKDVFEYYGEIREIKKAGQLHVQIVLEPMAVPNANLTHYMRGRSWG